MRTEPCRIKLTDGCLVRGVAYARDTTLAVDPDTAMQVIGCGRAVFADAATARRFRPVIEWVDPDAKNAAAPSVRVISAA